MTQPARHPGFRPMLLAATLALSALAPAPATAQTPPANAPRPAPAAPPCPAPGQIALPLSQAIQARALRLRHPPASTPAPATPHAWGSPGALAQYRETVLANLEGRSTAERDALLLATLYWASLGSRPMVNLTTFEAAALFDIHLDLLDRHGLDDLAGAMRQAQAAFPVWDTTARARYAQWSDGNGRILNPALDQALTASDARFAAGRETLLTRAETLLRDDPALPEYEALLARFDASMRISYMMQQINRCLPAYTTPAEADAALAAVPPLLADLHVIDLFLGQALNGGMHQYLSNSTGVMAPQLADVLHRWGLRDAAAAVDAALALFPAPYPRDRQARHRIMSGFDAATDEALNAPTWISDDPAIWDAIEARARAAGYWPL